MWEKLKRCYVWNHQSPWTSRTDFSRITSWMWDLALSSMFDVLRKHKWMKLFCFCWLQGKGRRDRMGFSQVTDCVIVTGKSWARLELLGALNPQFTVGALYPNGVPFHLLPKNRPLKDQKSSLPPPSPQFHSMRSSNLSSFCPAQLCLFLSFCPIVCWFFFFTGFYSRSLGRSFELWVVRYLQNLGKHP